MFDLRPNDRIEFLDFDGTQKQGVIMGVTTTRDDLGVEVVIVNTTEGTRWCYRVQVNEANGIDMQAVYR